MGKYDMQYNEVIKMRDEDGRGVQFLCMRQLKAVKIRRFVRGKESVSLNFSPGARGVPDEFLIIPDVAWRECGVGDLSGSVRRYVESLSGDGERVESYVSDSGIVCFELAFNGERRSLWFNFHTSDSVVLDAEGKVCENIRRAICGGDFESLSVPEARFTSPNQNCYDTDNKQKSFVSTGLRNECRTGYWMEGNMKTRKGLSNDRT